MKGSEISHVGLLAHSTEGAALSFLTFTGEGGKRLGEFGHPQITLDCAPLAASMPHYDSGNLLAVRAIMTDSIARLANAGADFFFCPDNTVHQALELGEPDFAIPGLHIAEVVANAAVLSGFHKVGILGTRYLMQSRVYPDACERRNLAWQVPSQENQQVVHDVIFGELLDGIVRPESGLKIASIMDEFVQDGCDVIALVCTELPMLSSVTAWPVSTLDSNRLISIAALDAALRGDLPTWRGGVVR